MSRWFAINKHYYRLNAFTHFEVRKQVFRKTEKWDIKGYHAFPVTWDDERDPNIKTQSYVCIGGINNNYASEAEAAQAVEDIIKGKFDTQVKADTVFVTNSHHEEDGEYGFQVLTHPN